MEYAAAHPMPVAMPGVVCLLGFLRPGRGDIDALLVELGFNVAQAAVPVFLLAELGYPAGLAISHILPGSALGFAVGAFWLAVMGVRLAAREHRRDVTAHVYGSNVPGIIAFTLSIMIPVFHQTRDPLAAWAVAAAAAIWTGIFKVAAAPLSQYLRALVPKPAAMTVFAAAMYTYLGMALLVRLFDQPIVGLCALALVFVGLFADIPFTRYRIPGFLVVWLVPLAIAIGLGYTTPRFGGLRFTIPAVISLAPLWKLPAAVPFFSVIIPVALYQMIQDLAAVEAADTTGDRYELAGILLGDGIATIIGGIAGSPITNLVYSLQPPFKKLGARVAFQFWTPLIYLGLTVAGLGPVGAQLFPWPILAAITTWVAVEVGMTAIRAVPARHRPALLFGLLIPAGYLLSAPITSSLFALHLDPASPAVTGALEHAIYWQAVLGLADGFLLVTLVSSAVIVYLIDHRFTAAGAWGLVGAGLSWFGVIHSARVGWRAAPAYALGWLALAVLTFAARWYRGPPQPNG